jgi:hypothetical protein
MSARTTSTAISVGVRRIRDTMPPARGWSNVRLKNTILTYDYRALTRGTLEPGFAAFQ